MQTNITDTYKKVGAIIGDLQHISHKTEVEQVFARHNVADICEKINLLRECMGVVDIADTGDALTMEENYNDELVIFCEGSWRMLG